MLLLKLVKDEAMEKTLMFLVMSHDDASGRIKLDAKTNGAFIEWDDVGRQKNFERVDEYLLKVTKQLGGTYVKNPLWTSLFDKQLVTVHPLGGCPMGNNGKTGVVNHKGQVFLGNERHDMEFAKL